MMETRKLIDALANDPVPVATDTLRRRFAMTFVVGGLGAFILLLAYLGLRPDLADAARTPMFWVKLGFPLALMAIALVGASRLARPGKGLGHAATATMVPVVLIWLMGGAALAYVAPEARLAMVLGQSWKVCPFNIAMLSVPAFVAVFWAMKGMAPTRPAAAGAFSGLLAGSLGAAVYCLHCPEMAPPFLGTWYLLGMLIPTAAGALIGPRLLRW
jgi:hypothetical protein